MGQKIWMLLEEAVQLPFSHLGIIQQLVEQRCFVVAGVPLAPNGHKAVKPPPVFPSEIEFALVRIPFSECSFDTIEPVVNSDQESNPFVFSHRAKMILINDF